MMRTGAGQIGADLGESYITNGRLRPPFLPLGQAVGHPLLDRIRRAVDRSVVLRPG